MQFALRFLSRWFTQPDKILHGVVGFVAFIALMFLPLPIPAAMHIVAALEVVYWLGWGKEQYDKSHTALHTYDGWDALATVRGALTAALLWASSQLYST